MHSFSFCLTTFVCLLSVLPLNAQDSIKNLRAYPPSHQSKAEVDIQMSSLKWQFAQKEALEKKLRKSRDHIVEEIAKLEQKIEELKAELDHSQHIDQSTRSRLAAKMMEEILDSSLELAALEKSADDVNEIDKESTNSKVHQLKARQLQAAISKAESKMKIAADEVKHAKTLSSGGALSIRETKRKEYQLQIAKIELVNAKTELEIEQLQEKSKNARTLTDIRIKSAPVTARIRYAAKILKNYEKDDKIVARIDRLENEKSLWMADMKSVAQEMGSVSREIMELKNLRELVEKDLSIRASKDKKADAKAKAAEK